jgi:coatomer protein complex subunit gamma
MGAIPETKESSLLHLCEFIEDCEFSELIIQTLYILGSVGPHTPSPSRYIRYVYNRVILETASVRAAAVSTLGTFATRVPELRPSIVSLLKSSLADEDDEVRDRAAILLQSLGAFQEDAELRFVVDEPMPMTFAALERSVRAYVSHPMYNPRSMGAISFASLPIVEEAYVPAATANVRAGAKKKSGSAPAASSSDAADESQVSAVDPAAALYALPQFAKLGRAFRSTAETSLTETEMEYVVSCVKHIFADHVVLQFNVLNTIDDQQLRDVKVNVELGDPDAYSVETVVPAAVARYGEPAACFVSLRRSTEGEYGSVSISCELSFKMLQVDPVTGEVDGSSKGFDEEFPLEDLEVSTNDFMAKVSLGDFRRSWDSMGADGEVLEKFALQFKKKEEAVAAIIEFLGMQAVDGTQTVAPDDAGPKKPHTLHLAGVFVGNVPVLVRAQIQMDDANTSVVLKMAVRSQSKEVSQIVAECIR